MPKFRVYSVAAFQTAMLTDKAPYIVTIIMAALTWAVSHMADRLLSTPMIKYSLQKIVSKDSQTLYLTFKNITRDKTFRKLEVILNAPPDGVIKSGVVIPVQPALEGHQPPRVAGGTFLFTFLEFQPGWQIEISANYTGSTQPGLRLSSPDQTVYATLPSVQSFAVEYDIEILAVIAAIWILALILIWIFALTQKTKPEAIHYD